MKVERFTKTIHFVFEDENSGLEYRINNLNCTEDEFYEWLETFNYEHLEKEYGVHDFSGSSNNKEIVIGFSSYEISKNDFKIVMETWKNGLLDAGFITDEHNIKIEGEEQTPTIVIVNEIEDKTIILKIEGIESLEFEDNVDPDFAKFIEDELCGDDFGIYEYDGNQGEDDYLIVINDEKDDWEKSFKKVVKKIKNYFDKQQIKYSEIKL